MSDKQDTELTDLEFQDYLKGGDGVSAAYHELSTEQPSAELDAQILQAAKDNIRNTPQPKQAFPYQRYSIAASVFLSVFIVSLYFNNEAEFTQLNSVENFQPTIQLEENVPVFEGNPAGAGAADNEAADANAVNVRAESRVAESQILESIEAPQLDLELEGVAEAAPATDVQTNLVNANSLAPLRAFQAETLFEENPDYRSSADLWLLEIQRLSTENEVNAAEEERSLFAEVYPDINIDAELSELEQLD